MERLQKFLSNAGIASRRAAEQLIISGKVKINGRIVRELGVKVNPEKDRVEIDGRRVRPQREFLYIVLNKPAETVSSRKDRYGRTTVYDFLPVGLRQKLWSVGRLDHETEGLLLFTNDGELTQKITHPSFGAEKEYRVLLDKTLKDRHKKTLEHGIKIGEYTTAPAKVKIDDGEEIRIIIKEGKKRQVRRMFNELKYTVLRLERIREGKLSLKKLKLRVGEIREVKKDDII